MLPLLLGESSTNCECGAICCRSEREALGEGWAGGWRRTPLGAQERGRDGTCGRRVSRPGRPQCHEQGGQAEGLTPQRRGKFSVVWCHSLLSTRPGYEELHLLERRLCTHIVYTYSVWCTHILYTYLVHISCTHIVYSWLRILCMHIMYTYSVVIMYAYDVCVWCMRLLYSYGVLRVTRHVWVQCMVFTVYKCMLHTLSVCAVFAYRRSVYSLCICMVFAHCVYDTCALCMYRYGICV